MQKFIKKISLSIIFILLISFFISLFNFNYIKAEEETENFYLVKYETAKTRQEIADIYNISINKVEELSEFDVFRIELKEVSYFGMGGFSPYAIIGQEREYYELDHRYHIPDYKIPDEVSSEYEKPEYQANLTPNDPNYSNQWGLPKIDAPEAWDKTTGSTDVIIAIIDTGIDGTHSDLSGKVLAGYNYVNNTSISANSDSDDQGHGTSVGGTAAAISNNSIGISGTDWNARLMPVKVLDNTGYGYASDVAYGIRYAADNGAKVINLSLGSTYSSSIIDSAVNYAHDLGCILVAASGNGNNDSISYPARYGNTIAVGATNQSDVRCDNSDWGAGYGSNYGPNLDVVAPGNSIYSLADGGGYRTVSGTSLSTPYVAGLASLMTAFDNTLSNSAIKSHIIDNADKVAGMGGQNFTNYYGYGRINADEALQGLGTYNATWNSQSAYLTGWPTMSAAMNVTFTNTGTATWTNTGNNPVRLATDKYQDESFLTQFMDGSWLSSYRIANLNEASVAPGATGSFNFSISTPYSVSIGENRFYVRMVVENQEWFENGGAWWSITVPQPQATWVSQSAYPTASPGDTVPLSVSFRNNSGVSWHNNGPAVRLATDKYQDENFLSRFNDGSWLSTYRIADLSTASVTDGATTTFNFNLKIPSDLSPGYYKFYVRLVSEGFSWFDNPDINGGAWWGITVQ